MPRILMVIRPGGGGAFGHVARLSAELSTRGYEVAICGPHAPRAGIEVEVIPLAMQRSLSVSGDLRAVHELSAIYRCWRPDLIHAHGSKGGIIARLARYGRPKTPLIHTPHGYAFSLQVVNGRQRAIYRSLEQLAAPLTTRVLAVCEHEARLAAGLGLGRRARVVHNGISSPVEVSPQPLVAELGKRGPVICITSELHPRKGTLTFINSVPRLLERFPRASVVWAGDGPDRGLAEQRIAELGLSSSVHLLGLVKDVDGILFGSDLFVSPSWAESFPYSVLEAMGARRPIVATDVGGVGEAIEDRVTGRLVPARDSYALADGMIDLLSNPELAQSLGEAAHGRVVTSFSLQTMIEGTIAVYGELEP